MNGPVTIIKSRVWKHSNIIWTILKSIPTLEPFIIFSNTPVYILYKKNSMVGFVCIKKWDHIMELRALYVFPTKRGHGYAKLLCEHIVQEFPGVYLLCRPDLVPLYSQCGFSIVSNPAGVMKTRQQLNTWFIAPFTGYKIVVMKNHPR